MASISGGFEHDNLGQKRDKNKVNIISTIPKSEIIWNLVWYFISIVLVVYITYNVCYSMRAYFKADSEVVLWIITVIMGIVVFFICILHFGYSLYDEAKRMLNENKKLLNNVAGGIMITYFDDSLTVKNATPVFYNLICYEKCDFQKKFHGEFSRILVGDESRREFARQKRLLRDSGYAEAQYKIRRGDGEYIWLSSRSHVTQNEKYEKIVYTVIFDITREREMQEKLLLVEARNKIVFENINVGVFEWDLMNNSLKASNQFVHRFMANKDIALETHYLIQMIHSDDRESFNNVISLIREGIESDLEMTFLIKDATGKYTHNSFRIISIRDNNYVPVKAIGIVVDVEKQYQREIELRHKADRDSLTGLYNKGTTEQLIETIILSAKGQNHALIVFDIDNFKTINDSFGHDIGDEAIKNVGKTLTKIFGDEDIVGRIGGDEFMVFCRNVDENGNDIVKALEQLKSNKAFIVSGNMKYEISMSIGIAMFSIDDGNYKGLYKKSDIALYRSKQDGKDKYTFFKDISEPKIL